MRNKEYLNEETINYLISHLKNKKDFTSIPVSERREYEDKLGKQIDVLLLNKDYDKRNVLVELQKHIVKNLPFDFEENEEVLVKGKRVIKASILEINPVDRQVLVKPIDSVFKQNFYCSESMIISLKKKEEDTQMRLF